MCPASAGLWRGEQRKEIIDPVGRPDLVHPRGCEPRRRREKMKARPGRMRIGAGLSRLSSVADFRFATAF